MPEKKEEIKEELSIVAYTLGILSIALSFFTPLAGIVVGIIGIVQSRKNSNIISKRAKKLSIIGIIISFIVLIISLAIVFYSTYTQLGSLANFPVA